MPSSAGGAGDVHIGRGTPWQAGRVAQGDQARSPKLRRKPQVPWEELRESEGRVVAQVLANPRAIDGDLNPQGPQVCARTNPASHENSRRLECTRCQNDASCLHAPRGPVLVPDSKFFGAAAGHEQFRDEAVRGDLQVGASPGGRVEIGCRGRDALVLPVGKGRWKNAVLEFAVLVQPPRETRGVEGGSCARAGALGLFFFPVLWRRAKGPTCQSSASTTKVPKPAARPAHVASVILAITT